MPRDHMKVIRVDLTKDEWNTMTPFLDHFGDISSFVRKAIKERVCRLNMEAESVRLENDKGRGTSTTQVKRRKP